MRTFILFGANFWGMRNFFEVPLGADPWLIPSIRWLLDKKSFLKKCYELWNDKWMNMIMQHLYL